MKIKTSSAKTQKALTFDEVWPMSVNGRRVGDSWMLSLEYKMRATAPNGESYAQPLMNLSRTDRFTPDKNAKKDSPEYGAYLLEKAFATLIPHLTSLEDIEVID